MNPFTEEASKLIAIVSHAVGDRGAEACTEELIAVLLRHDNSACLLALGFLFEQYITKLKEFVPTEQVH